MNSKVIKECSMVKPAKETPRRSLWLSSLDLTVVGRHLCTVYVYHPDKNNENSNFFDTKILKESLSQVLVPFYPLAGRLKEDANGRVELDCDPEGALFVEAETTHSLADFSDDFKPTPQLMGLVIPSCEDQNYLVDDKTWGKESSIPLVMAQLTRFRCGGVTFGFAIHHSVADGYTGVYLINSWARLARGAQLEVVPFHDRTPYLEPRSPPQVLFKHFEYDPPKISPASEDLEKDSTTISFFKMTNDQINALKRKAANSFELDCDHKLSTYEVLAAHILSTACKARGLADDREVKFYIPADGRYRLKNPALPHGFCGNALFMPVYRAKSGEITGNPLGYVASKIHEAVKIMTNESYLRSTIDYLETHPNRTSLVRGPHTYRCPNFSVNSWLQLPFYDADFGWGKPVIAGRNAGTFEGQSYLVRGPNRDEGILLMISLFSQHMILFEKYLYDF